MTEKQFSSSSKVVIKYIRIYDGEKVLILEPAEISWVFALAKKYPNSDFIIYQSDLGKYNLFSRNLRESFTVQQRMSIISNYELSDLKTPDNMVDTVIYQPEKFSALNLIKLQSSMSKLVLKENGKFYLISHMRTGAIRHSLILEEVFETNVKIIGKGGGGYRIAEIINVISQAKADVNIRNRINFQIIGLDLSVDTENSLFSKDKLDIGTKVLLENVDLSHFERMLDLGCGWGAIGIVAALANPKGHVVLIDINTRATTVAFDNIKQLKIGDRCQVIATDDIKKIDGNFDLILSNPPFHADLDMLKNLFVATYEKLKTNGLLYIVVEQTYILKFKKILEQIFTNVTTHFEDRDNHFLVLTASKLSRA